MSRAVAADHAVLLQPREALGHRRRREADAAAELGERQARVGLQLGQQADVGVVERGRAAVRPKIRSHCRRIPSKHHGRRPRRGIVRCACARPPPHLYFVVSAIFHYLGPAFAVLLFARVDVARRRVAADRLRRARVRALAPAVAPVERAWTRRAALLVQWGVVLALMNCCFYVAIDRLPLGTVAAIEFLPVIALAALGARTPRNAAALALAVPGVYLLRGVRFEGEPLGRRVRVRQRRACSRSTSCSPTAPPGTRRSPASTGSGSRC